ncbi:protein kinase domain-containing protein [Ruminococcus albus]|uniref:Protein kinase domain-containing protein n=1 Tax=Ruminococcus albus TaxID=1264 RepID=A0A1H7FMR6_RUMAL|nr:protein kinase [Ruminococcus albus]SEK27279.1 Protein kinase domain-containing protein [Ruminococcus albus]
MENSLERRLSQYEPLWNEWYIDSFMWEDDLGSMFSLKDKNGRKSAVRVLTVDSTACGRPLSELTAAAIKRINARLPLAGEAFLVSARNFTVKNIENVGAPPVAADILVQTDDYRPLEIDGQMPYITARKLADNICRGIRTAHRNGFTFGDICPKNLRVDSEGHFCLDAPCTYLPALADHTYAAPETFSENYDHFKADIYSYGIMLYQLFNGGLLPLQKEGESPENAVKSRLDGQPFDPPAGAPPDIGRFIMQCCMAHPESRYADMDEVYRVLSQLTMDSIPPQYEACYVPPEKRMGESKKVPETKESSVTKPLQPPQTTPETAPLSEEKESRGMRLYVLVLLYMLLAAGGAFLIYSIFFLK